MRQRCHVRVAKATPATLVDVVPLVWEADGWRVDLPLFERRHEWSHLLTSPLPDSADSVQSEDSSSPEG
jgi:hypothetical protein